MFIVLALNCEYARAVHEDCTLNHCEPERFLIEQWGILH